MNFGERWKGTMHDMTVPLFDVVISNPPYQTETSGRFKNSTRIHSERIYDIFHEDASRIAQTVIMIYPASWQSSVTRYFGEFLFQYGGVQTVTNYNGSDVFDTAITAHYPISIVHSIRGYTGDVYANGVIMQRNTPYWLDSRKKAIAYHRAATLRKTQHISGQPHAYDLTSLKNIQHAAELGVTFHKTSENLTSPVRMYIKQTYGTAADSGYYYVERADVAPYFANSDDIDAYNVSVQAMFFKQMRNFKLVERGNIRNFGARVSPPGEGFGVTWRNLRNFDTLQEAENFAHYMNSTVMTVLATLVISSLTFGEAVPDLDDYSNANPLFAPDDALPAGHEYRGLSLDARLYAFFGFTVEEQQLFEL